MILNGKFSSQSDAVQFIKGGNAYVTFRNKETQKRFTYRVKKHSKKEIYFVSVLYGPDNGSDYVYIGCIFDSGVFNVTRGTRVSKDDVRVKGFTWVWNHLRSNTLPDVMEVWHEGRCGRCGRMLTVPESVESGFGPHCIKMAS